MAAVNYAESYQKALANTYAYSMYFGKLFTTPNNNLYKVVDARTIKIPVMNTTGRVDGTRDTIGTFKRNADNDWETKILTNHRTWDTLVHPQDVAQTGGALAIQNITQTFNEQQKLPEKQAYLVSKLYADWTEQGETAITTELTTENVLSIVDDMMEKMDEARVPAAGRILYVTPRISKLFKQILKRGYSNESDIKRSVTRIDEVEITSVSSDLMKTAYNFTEGYAPASGAKQINMFLVHPSCVLTPENYTFVGLENPSVMTQGKYAYFEEAFEDVFLLNQRKGALNFAIASAT